MKSSKPEITEEMIQEEMARQAHGDYGPPAMSFQRVKVVYSFWTIAGGVLVGNLLTSVIVGIAWWLITL